MNKGWVLAVVVIVCLVLGGCGAAGKGEVSLMVFGEPAELAAYQSLVDAFHSKYPDIQVELRHVASQGDYQKQLVTAFSAGAQPDVMLLNYRRMLQFAAPGGLEPLTSYMDKSTALDAEAFYPQAIEAFQWNGELWCVPQNMSSLVVYYNRGLFQAAGVAFPTAGWTWSEFLQAARALTRDVDGDGQIDQYGAAIAPELMRLAVFVWQNGGAIVDDQTKPTRLTLDSPEALAAFQWLVDLQVKEHVVPDAAAEQAEDGESRFMSGSVAMFFNSRRGVPTYRTVEGLDWDVAPLPRGVQAAGMLHSDGYCLSAKTHDKDAAWTLIEFANSVEGQTLMAGTGRTVPSLKAVAESAAFLDPAARPASSRVFLDAIPELRRMPLHVEWPRIEETANGEIERAFYGQASVEEAVRTAIEQTATYFEKE